MASMGNQTRSGGGPAPGAVADAPAGNWVDRYAEPAVRPYLRLMRADRLIGAWLLMLPGWQAIALAGGWAEWSVQSSRLATFGWVPVAWLFVAFALGAVLMRGAGCVFNDLMDRDIDAKVARTQSRPLVSGDATVFGALALLATLCAAGLAILSSFNSFAVMVGLMAAVPVAIYPFMKRITHWPQAVLGLAFGWGALLGWAAMTGGLHAPAIALYASVFAWVIGYDTIYAHQDREDDALIGVRSTALLFGQRTWVALLWFYGFSVAFAGLAGALAELGPWFWVGLAAYALHLVGQVARLDVNDPDLCLHLFRSNREAGLLLLAAIVLGSL
ncbi:MAG: 4-hydroxybenzoate octaprenyltransferase [Pseudomonadota bacterium]